MGKSLKGKELGSGISQRKDGRYQGRYTDRNGKRKTIYGNKLQDVKKELANIKYEMDHGFYSSDCKMNVTSWFEFWIKNYKCGKVREATIRTYKNSFRHIEKVIGFMLMADVRPMHCQKVINEMEEQGYMFGTMNLVRVTMHAMFKQAVYNDIILRNPAEQTVLPQDTKRERRVLTPEEQELFLEYAKGTSYELAFRFCLLTGLRYGELAGLTIDCVDFDKKEISVEKTITYSKEMNCFKFTMPKTRTSVRQVPLCEESIGVLKEAIREKKKRKLISENWNEEKQFDDLIFTTKNGRPCGNSHFNNSIKSIVRQINRSRMLEAKLSNIPYEEFKPFSIHSLRHTFATRCFEAGMKQKVVQEILGHADQSMTEVYIHVTNQHMHDDFDKFKNHIKMA